MISRARGSALTEGEGLGSPKPPGAASSGPLASRAGRRCTSERPGPAAASGRAPAAVHGSFSVRRTRKLGGRAGPRKTCRGGFGGSEEEGSWAREEPGIAGPGTGRFRVSAEAMGAGPQKPQLLYFLSVFFKGF